MSDKVQGIKASPVGADRLIIRDTEDSEKLKEITVNGLNQGVLHSDVPDEINNITTKALPVPGDFMLIEDSEDLFNKKKIPLSTVGGGGGGIPDAPIDTKVYARQDGNWVDPNIDLVSSRIAWEASTPPEYQFCLADDVSQVITFSTVSLIDPRISIDLGLGEITVLEDLKNMVISINMQVIRQSAANVDSIWGFDAEVWDGLAWTSYPSSTKYLSFTKDDSNQIRTMSITVIFDVVTNGTKFRFKQITDNAGLNTGLVSAKPFTSMPISPGFLISIGTR